MFIEHSPFNRWSGQYDSFSLAIYSEFAMFGLLNPGVQGAQDDAYRRVCGEPAMSPHRLFRIPMVRTVALRSSRPLLHHRRHRCGLGVARLEDRTLLSGPSGDVLNVVLFVADLTGNGSKDIIYADKGLDRVVVDYGAGGSAVLGDQATGLLSPGAVTQADLNGNGIPDLIVANSGSNNVLIYPGLGNGQFGPAHGYFVGTNPVGITVAILTGALPDLVVADKGSNQVSILVNQSQYGGAISFIAGPRLNSGGTGPVSTVVGNFDGKRDLLTVNSGSNDLTLIPDFLGSDPVTTTISSGGLDPVAAFEFSSGSGFDNLVVANNGDGTFALLEGGPHGLNLTSTETEPGLPHPTGLAFWAFTGG